MENAQTRQGTCAHLDTQGLRPTKITGTGRGGGRMVTRQIRIQGTGAHTNVRTHTLHTRDTDTHNCQGHRDLHTVRGWHLPTCGAVPWGGGVCGEESWLERLVIPAYNEVLMAGGPADRRRLGLLTLHPACLPAHSLPGPPGQVLQTLGHSGLSQPSPNPSSWGEKQEQEPQRDLGCAGTPRTLNTARRQGVGGRLSPSPLPPLRCPIF